LEDTSSTSLNVSAAIIFEYFDVGIHKYGFEKFTNGTNSQPIFMTVNKIFQVIVLRDTWT
jgi:hypothetical protein